MGTGEGTFPRLALHWLFLSLYDILLPAELHQGRLSEREITKTLATLAARAVSLGFFSRNENTAVSRSKACAGFCLSFYRDGKDVAC